MTRVAAALVLVLASGTIAAAQPTPPIYVTLWFDTEDYILTQDDDATKRLAEMLTRAGVKATFKIVGEKARVLEKRGRTDVINALKKHDIGYHSNTHSVQPTVAVYLQHAGWEDGAAEFYRREIQGVRDVTRIFGVTPVCYGQPGAAWAPQTYPALAKMGIGMYLDEADHVGIADQPFYFGGMLNVFKMRSMLARMDLAGGASLSKGKATFTKAYDTLRARGGGTISVYYHPNEWVQTEFWDGVNFSHGANPPRSEWKPPGMRPAAETEAAFSDFEQYLQFMKAQPGVQFVTATDLMRLYQDRAATRTFSTEELLGLARAARDEITFQTRDGYAVSAADAFVLINAAVESLVEHGKMPTATPLVTVAGPSRAFEPSAGGPQSTAFAWTAFALGVRETGDFLRANKQIPAEIWIGAESLSPAEYLATLAGAFDAAAASGAAPARVERRAGHFTADRYVAEDSTALWSWPIFPDGFHAPTIMALARLQAWTLKPAMLAR